MNVPTTEDLLTHPSFFGLTTATRVQRAVCRALDGLPLRELASDRDVIAAFGGEAAIANLESADRAPAEGVVLGAIRTAKTLTSAAHLVRLSQAVDLSVVGVGDIVRLFVVALKLEGTRALMHHLTAHLTGKPALRALVCKDARGDLDCSTTGVTLRHPSGHPIEVAPVPLDRAGGSGISVYCAGAILDEAPRMLGASDAVKNADDFLAAIEGRTLPGAKILSIGSPWAPIGPIFERVQRSYGKPSSDVVVARVAGPAGNPVWWTPQRMADQQRRNPRAFRTDVLAEFAEGAASVFSLDEVNDSMRTPSSIVVGQPILFVDASSGGGDSAVAIPIAWATPQLPREAYLWNDLRDARGHLVERACELVVDEYGEPVPNPEFKGERMPVLVAGEPLAFDGKFREQRGRDFEWMVGHFARYAHQVGALRVIGDQHLAFAMSPAFRKRGLRFTEIAWSDGRKEAAIDWLRILFRDRRIILPNDPVLRRELLVFSETPKAGGGIRYEARRGHDDRVMAIALAAAADIEGLLPRSPIRMAGARNPNPPTLEQRTGYPTH